MITYSRSPGGNITVRVLAKQFKALVDDEYQDVSADTVLYATCDLIVTRRVPTDDGEPGDPIIGSPHYSELVVQTELLQYEAVFLNTLLCIPGKGNFPYQMVTPELKQAIKTFEIIEMAPTISIIKSDSQQEYVVHFITSSPDVIFEPLREEPSDVIVSPSILCRASSIGISSQVPSYRQLDSCYNCLGSGLHFIVDALYPSGFIPLRDDGGMFRLVHHKIGMLFSYGAYSILHAGDLSMTDDIKMSEIVNLVPFKALSEPNEFLVVKVDSGFVTIGRSDCFSEQVLLDPQTGFQDPNPTVTPGGPASGIDVKPTPITLTKRLSKWELLWILIFPVYILLKLFKKL